jgi:hypothetical protein
MYPDNDVWNEGAATKLKAGDVFRKVIQAISEGMPGPGYLENGRLGNVSGVTRKVREGHHFPRVIIGGFRAATSSLLPW